jgi:flavin reductase (DIM6/NTAB) family NADH-FMN oxidoreductase RutF
MTSTLEQAQLRQVFAAFPTGVAAVAAVVDGEPTGLAANSFVSVSLVPPLVSVCIGHSSTTWPGLRTAPRLGISVLGAHQETASRQLSSRDGERFAGLDWRATPHGAVLVCEASAWFDCSIEQEIPAGDHDIVLLSVHDLGASEAMPLVFHGSTYRQLLSYGQSRSQDGRLHDSRSPDGHAHDGRGVDGTCTRPAGRASREHGDQRYRLGA